jgi:transposase
VAADERSAAWEEGGSRAQRGRQPAVLNACLWVLRSGAHWHDLPERYGKWKSVHKRFGCWAEKGVWERVFTDLIDDPDNAYVMLDTTLIRAHQQAAGGNVWPAPLQA